jgi:primosomal protein N' (replication factor Y)
LSANLKVNSGSEVALTLAQVALDVPIANWFDYRLSPEWAARIRPGSWVEVPWGSGRRIGLVIGLADESTLEARRLREVIRSLDEAPILPDHWLALIKFASAYYHRGYGEIGLPPIPKMFRTPAGPRARQSAFARMRAAKKPARGTTPLPDSDRAGEPLSTTGPNPTAALDTVLSPAQQAAVDALLEAPGFSVQVLHGVTGSGKTEVYLHWFAEILARNPQAQVLLMAPEIALTPQLASLVRRRFQSEQVVVLHSAMPEAERARGWLAAADGRARVVIGTRLSVLTPMPGLAAIVVDEEHDASYRQHDGVHYSARDLAIAAAQHAGIPVLLGSATPSIETWRAVRRGRYRLLSMPQRMGSAQLPSVETVDLRRDRSGRPGTLSAPVLAALESTLATGDQALVFINRRGYAPVMQCEACGWVSRCDHCSAWRVLHRQSPEPDGQAESKSSRYRLQCHHCGQATTPPRACPECGSIGLVGLGRGTQRIEEELAERFPGHAIGRLDRDVAQRRGAAQAVIDSFHQGKVQLLIGTQMLAKGHDFRRLSLVVVAEGDAGLFSADFRAPERLFATLMQVAGRAGRGAQSSRVLIQTRYPEHPLFAHLAQHDYVGFADRMLEERRDAAMPPFSHQALLRADAQTLEPALAWLAQARESGVALCGTDTDPQLFDPVPMPMQRLKGRERAQLLIEARSRARLHAFLDRWLPVLRSARPRMNWQIEIDPAEV